MDSSHNKKINPRILEKLNSVLEDAPDSLKEFFVELLVWQVDVETKGHSENEILEGYAKKLEKFSKIDEINKYLEEKNAS